MKSCVLTSCALLLVVALPARSQSPKTGGAGPKKPASQKVPYKEDFKDEKELVPPSSPVGRQLPSPSPSSLRRVLALTVEMPTLTFTVRETLDFLAEQVARQGNQRLDVFIDQAGIRLHQHPGAGDLDFLVLPLTFSPQGRRMTVQQVFDHIAAESGTNPGDVEVTYLLRQGRVEIVPVEFARIDYLLDRGATLQFRDTSMAKALEEISDATGVTIAVDPRCAEALQQPFSLRTGHDMSVRGVLECLADMHELRLIVDEHRVFLTTEAQYLKRLRARVEEAKLQRELDPAFAVPLPPGGPMQGGIGLGGGVAPGGPSDRPRQYGRRNRENAGAVQ